MLRYLYISTLILLLTIQSFTQHKWVPFLQQTKTAPSITLSSSGNSNISFNVKINGMTSADRKVGEIIYQQLSIPNSDMMSKEGLPQVPMITKLIAIPDCDDISISVTHSNKLKLEKYNVLPTPRLEKKKSPDGSEISTNVFEENKSTYSSNADFPGKYGEILETGYVRGQKVARVAIYPIQFNPVNKSINIFTDFNISLSFVNPSSTVSKELGIFRNMIQHTALNYDLGGMNASTKVSDINKDIRLNKSADVSSTTTASVSRVTNLSTLVGANAIPVDYLIITHSTLFNSNSLTTLANLRRDLNGFDVAIVYVDDCVYDAYPDPNLPQDNYVSMRNFIADVYANGKANHTGDGHLGYILLVGDALQDNNVDPMLPASYEYHDSYWGSECLDAASDYYYACLTHSGTTYDDLQDVMYGRLPVGNETELSNNVNKIISYEYNTNGSWVEDYTFVAFSPDLFWYADWPIEQMTETIPSTISKSYAYRAYTGDATYVSEANPIYGQTFTPAQYNDPAYLCGADLLDNWVYDNANAGINNRVHTFVYEGHGGPFGFGAEGCGRKILGLEGHSCTGSYINDRLNNDLYSFMIFVACQTGYFDHTSGDCEAEAIVNIADRGAIGVLASSRTSYTSAFGEVDGGILNAMHNNLSHVMGEAVMESKNNLWDVLFRRQYNLYGDPAVNLWPTGYTVTENTTLSGTIDITQNITVESGATLTIASGATLQFAPNVSLTAYGTLNVNGTTTNPVTFTSQSGTSPGSWGSIVLEGNGATNSSINYANIQYGTEVRLNSVASAEIQYCNIANTINGIYSYNSTCTINDNTLSNQRDHGIIAYNSSLECNRNIITKSDNSGAGMLYTGGGYSMSGYQNDIYGYNWGIGSSWGAYVRFPNNGEKNNRVTNCLYGLYVYQSGTVYIPGTTYGENSVFDNTYYNAYVYASSNVYASNNYWGRPVPTNKFYYESGSYLDRSDPLSRDPWEEEEQMVSGNTFASSNTTFNKNQPIEDLSSSVSSDIVNQARELREVGKKQEALKLLKSMFEKNNYTNDAITELYVLNEEPFRGEVELMLSSIPISKSPLGQYYYGLILSRKGDSKGALEAFGKLSETSFAKAGMLAQFYIYLYNKNNPQRAEELLNGFITSKNDEEIELSLARHSLNIATGKADKEGLPKNQDGKVTSIIPYEFNLEQNYPNPFNPTTMINYDLPKAGNVVLKVYDVLGKEVATLVNDYKEAGSYNVQFDASKLSNGMYIYKLTSDKFTEVKKMMLIK